jgi:hypothetical protein
MREAHAIAVLGLIAGLAGACSDDEPKSSGPLDGGAWGQMAEVDADVVYMGPTRGGQIPVGEELEPEKGDNGPFEVDDTCCDVTIAVIKQDGDVSARVVGDLPPLDGDGKAATVVSTSFSADVCMPASEAVRYRFEVEVDVDGGTETVYRTDPTQPVVLDANGEAWNTSSGICADAGS